MMCPHCSFLNFLRGDSTMIVAPHALAFQAVANRMREDESPRQDAERVRTLVLVRDEHCDDDALGWGCRYCMEMIGTPHESSCAYVARQERERQRSVISPTMDEDVQGYVDDALGEDQ
jgi:hypothetical protein